MVRLSLAVGERGLRTPLPANPAGTPRLDEQAPGRQSPFIAKLPERASNVALPETKFATQGSAPSGRLGNEE